MKRVIDRARTISEAKGKSTPKSMYDKLPEAYRPFDWSTPAASPGYEPPAPWRVSDRDKAEKWLKRVFGRIDDTYEVIVDTYGVDTYRGAEQLWVSVRRNDRPGWQEAVMDMADKIKGMAKVRLVKHGNDVSLYMVDDIKRNALKG